MINQNLLFFNIGGGELMIIVLFIIMFFGADKIPELARTIGKVMREIKNATDGIQQEIKESTKDISGLTNSVNIKKQVNDMIFNNEKSVEVISKVVPRTDKINTTQTPETNSDTIPDNQNLANIKNSEESKMEESKPIQSSDTTAETV